nr:NfeD family protein [uncultured Halomonas sp.]
MQWTVAHSWLALALILGLLELTSGALVLLALAFAAAGAGVVAYLGFGFTIQAIVLALLAGVLIPIVIRFIRPHFSPKGVRYGTTGSGAEVGQYFFTTRRDFDQAISVKINGDLYRARFEDESDPEENIRVVLLRFEGTVAVVKPAAK